MPTPFNIHMKRYVHGLWSGALVAASLMIGSPARGQGTDLSSFPIAQGLFEEAVKAMAANDYAAACPKLEEVVKLVPEGVGAKLTLAKCYEGANKLTSAWTLYTVVAAAPRENERAAMAKKRAAELRPTLAELTIKVPEDLQGLPGIEIRREGSVMSAAQWGVAIPIDKGVYRLSASAPGKRAWETVVRVEENGAHVEVIVGPLEDAPESARESQTGAQTPRTSADPAGAASSNREKGGLRALQMVGLTAGGVGVAGVGVGTALILMAKSKREESELPQNCSPVGCTAQGSALRSSANSLTYGATAAFIAGGALIASGVGMFLAPEPKEKSAKPITALVVAPMFSSHGTGIVIGGSL